MSSIIRAIVMMALTLVLVNCRQEKVYPTVPEVAFQQMLLRESVQFLSQASKCRISISEDVDRINNLYVDLPAMQERPLNVVLDAILAFVEKEHGVFLCWRPNGESGIIIEVAKRGDGRK